MLRREAAARLRRRLPRCGDGVRDPWDECDDGNRINGDGCTDECFKETSTTGSDGGSTSSAEGYT